MPASRSFVWIPLSFVAAVALFVSGCDTGAGGGEPKKALSTFEGIRAQGNDQQSVQGTATFVEDAGDLQVEVYLTKAMEEGPSLILRLRPAPPPGQSTQFTTANRSTWAAYFPGGACSIPLFLKRRYDQSISLTRTNSGLVTGQFAVEVTRQGIFVPPPPFLCDGDIPSYQRFQPNIQFAGEFVASASAQTEIPLDVFSALLTGSPDSPKFP